MIWQDIVVDRSLREDEIREGMKTMFGIDSRQIAVISSIAEIIGVGDARVACAVSPLPGPFCTMLSVYILDAEMPAPTPLEAVAKFCTALQCCCLVADDSPNPYSAWLMSASGEAHQVYLRPSNLDRNEYVISSRGRNDNSI